MRVIKVGINKEGTPYDNFQKASRTDKIMPGEIVVLEFNDGHTCQCVIAPGGDYLCSSCYIQRYAEKVGAYYACPRVNNSEGRLLCDIPGNTYCEFHDVSTILEEI